MDRLEDAVLHAERGDVLGRDDRVFRRFRRRRPRQFDAGGFRLGHGVLGFTAGNHRDHAVAVDDAQRGFVDLCRRRLTADHGIDGARWDNAQALGQPGRNPVIAPGNHVDHIQAVDAIKEAAAGIGIGGAHGCFHQRQRFQSLARVGGPVQNLAYADDHRCAFGWQ